MYNENTPRLATLLVIVMFIAASTLVTTSAFADDSSKHDTSDGHGYTRGHVIADFLDVAFTDRLWNDRPHKKDFSVELKNVKTPDNFPNESRFDEYFDRPNGLPKSNVINKWSGDITIGIGQPPRSSDVPANPKERYDVAQQQIESLIEPLQEATGRRVTLVPPGDPRDKGETIAQIRIIPTTHVHKAKPYDLAWVSKEQLESEYNPEPFFIDEEKRLWGGVRFEDADDKTMEGYLLPHSDNTLGIVICKINSKAELSLFKALVTECVVRAMGLPGVMEEESVVVEALGEPQATVLDTWHQGADAPEGTNPKGTTRATPPPHTLSSFDRLMLSLLYCSAIKPGMTKNEVIDVVSSDFCATAIEGHSP